MKSRSLKPAENPIQAKRWVAPENTLAPHKKRQQNEQRSAVKINKEQIQLVIFDCDGVLVDSEQICISTLRDLLEKNGIHRSFNDVVEEFHGLSHQQTMENLKHIFNNRIPINLERDLARNTVWRLENSLNPVEGVKAVLNEMAIPFCVASNGSKEKIVNSLSITGLLEKFNKRIFSAEDVAHPKPHPDLFLGAARALGAEPRYCVVVEDSLVGIQAAHAAGMRVYAYPGVTAAEKLAVGNPTAIISRMSELLALMKATGQISASRVSKSKGSDKTSSADDPVTRFTEITPSHD